MELGIVDQSYKKVAIKINWEQLGKLDLNQLKLNNDVETLESFMSILRQGRLNSKDFPKLKEIQKLNFLGLQQLMLQYMNYTQGYQKTMLLTIRDETEKTNQEIFRLEKQLGKSKEKIKQEKEEGRVQKEAVQAYKKAVQNQTIFGCYFCDGRNYVSSEKLTEHCKKFHDEELIKPEQVQVEQIVAVQTILLQQQVNSMIAAQNSQNSQLSALQSTAYFTALKIEQDFLDSDSESDTDSDEDEKFNLQLEQMRREQLEREIQFHAKIQMLEEALAKQNGQYKSERITEKNSEIELGGTAQASKPQSIQASRDVSTMRDNIRQSVQMNKVAEASSQNEAEMAKKIQLLQDQIDKMQKMIQSQMFLEAQQSRYNTQGLQLDKQTLRVPGGNRGSVFDSQTPSNKLRSPSIPRTDEENGDDLVDELSNRDVQLSRYEELPERLQELDREQTLQQFIDEEKAFFVALKRAKKLDPKKITHKREFDDYLKNQFENEFNAYFTDFFEMEPLELTWKTEDEIDELLKKINPEKYMPPDPDAPQPPKSDQQQDSQSQAQGLQNSVLSPKSKKEVKFEGDPQKVTISSKAQSEATPNPALSVPPIKSLQKSVTTDSKGKRDRSNEDGDESKRSEPVGDKEKKTKTGKEEKVEKEDKKKKKGEDDKKKKKDDGDKKKKKDDDTDKKKKKSDKDNSKKLKEQDSKGDLSDRRSKQSDDLKSKQSEDGKKPTIFQDPDLYTKPKEDGAKKETKSQPQQKQPTQKQPKQDTKNNTRNALEKIDKIEQDFDDFGDMQQSNNNYPHQQQGQHNQHDDDEQFG